jgi:hypothetical protein
MNMTDARATGTDARRPLLLIFGMPFIIAVLYYGWLTIAVVRTRFTWRDMDWNGDGRTSLGEFFETADVIERPVERDGRSCVELVWSRKGTVLRVECPAALPG